MKKVLIRPLNLHRWIPMLLVVLISGPGRSQTLAERLSSAWDRFVADSQLRYAVASLHVVDAASGQPVFDRNGRTGLAPASTQKVVTTITALDLLGPSFRYRTSVYLTGVQRQDTLDGDLVIRASGDPTFGSWRYAGTGRAQVLAALVAALQGKGVRYLTGALRVDDRRFSTQTIPEGWIWQDIGNYYGAGATGLNWNENQYDLYLDPGERVGDPARILRTEPEGLSAQLISELRTGPRGSGDQAYIFLPPYAEAGFVRGTIPLGERGFRISGSFPVPALPFLKALQQVVVDAGIGVGGGFQLVRAAQGPILTDSAFFSWVSPPMDSLVYWFNRKSVNLYGEALVKTMALTATGWGSTDTGLAVMRRFWRGKGVDPDALNLYDGSGLSPLNRITAQAQVMALQYARSRDWFPTFLASLPEYNGMTMKSGTISGVKGFCGYHKSSDGHTYVFSLLVNNYSGRTASLVQKMYRLLDVLK